MHIDSNMVPSILIDLGAKINVMTKETVLKINFQGALRKTTTILLLAYRPIAGPKGFIEDVMVSIDS